MAERKYIFGVRAQLALIITLLLAGVSGTQYVINYRQQREVLNTLVELNRQINETILHIDRQLKESLRPPGKGGETPRNQLQNFAVQDQKAPYRPEKYQGPVSRPPIIPFFLSILNLM